MGVVENHAHVRPFGTWVLSLLMMAGRLEMLPVVIILRRGFWR